MEWLSAQRGTPIDYACRTQLGISDKEMSAIAARGRIYRIGHGVYRVTDYIPVPNDTYADAVALVGPGAFL